MIRINEYPVPNLIIPRHVLVSTFDKSNLDVLVECILSANHQAVFYATGRPGATEGTGAKLQELLGSRAGNQYVSVEVFTGCPEMEGGLVKTLHPKIYAGLLAERNNPAHAGYHFPVMTRYGQGPGVYFDLFVGSLYPFNEMVGKAGVTAEIARCYIDIGGPSMTMAAAKNWHSMVTLTHPDQYVTLREILQKNNGGIPVVDRYNFAVEAMRVVAEFRMANYNHFRKLDFERDVLPTIKLET